MKLMPLATEYMNEMVIVMRSFRTKLGRILKTATLCVCLAFSTHSSVYAVNFVGANGVVEATGFSNSKGFSDAKGFSDVRSSGVYQLAQGGGVKSRSEVIREVKRRYNAEVLRISYDEARKVYRVRVLMRNGKVRNITVSARR